MFNKQEIFDKVSKHLVEQNRQCGVFAVSGIGAIECLYRDKKGLACAIGCLIPDDKYHQDMEGNGVIGKNPLVDQVIDELYSPDPGGYVFLSDLQNIHDHVQPQDWKKELRGYALSHGLIVRPWLEK